MALAPGSSVGSYRVVAKIGEGGMGEVYRATDSRLGRDVALKLLPPDVARNPDRLARFEREARAVASLTHPNIVVLHSIEDSDGVPFITMELVEGKRLDECLLAGGLPVPRVVDIALGIADALIAAHGRGIIHRDLKPANVMITHEGRVKMLDFGLARLLAEVPAESSETLTIASPLSVIGQVLGTVPYMAPEQVRGEPADARTDLFAAGVILYELLSGSRPFGGGSIAELSSSILRDAPRPLEELRGDLPSDLVRLVSRCLEKDRDRRVQTARDVRAELELVKRSLSAGAERAQPARPAPPHGEREPVKHAPSIAVLPFVNRSRDEADEYFADGLADELLTVLAKIRGLRVAARTSSFRFKGVHEDPAIIGQKLNVETILEGSVRKAGSRVRISVQLVKVADGYHLWSETYDRTLDDIFAVQDDIAQSVVKELRTTLFGEAPDSKASGEVRAEVAAATKGRGRDTEAYQLALQGRFLSLRNSTTDLEQGLSILTRATTLEPANAMAWAWIGTNRLVAGITGRGDLERCVAQARSAAERALELEPDLAEAHLAKAFVQFWYDFDWAQADASLRRAHELAPGSAEILATMGQLEMILGRFDSALDTCQRAVGLDPLSVPAHRFLAQALAAVGRIAEAEQVARLLCELAPAGAALRANLALYLLLQGKYSEALEEAGRESVQWARLTALAEAAFAAGDRAQSDAALASLIEHHGHEAAYQVAQVYAVRGDYDNAFLWLDKAHAQRDSGASAVKRDRLLDKMHGDPRWTAFLRKMNLA